MHMPFNSRSYQEKNCKKELGPITYPEMFKRDLIYDKIAICDQHVV